MTTTRLEPPMSANEIPMLLSWLEFHRSTLATKCAGLNEEQLKERAVAPSSLSLLGLVRHMAEVEREWFRQVFAGEDVPGIYASEQRPDDDIDDLDSTPVEQVFLIWQDECAHARRVAASAETLDELGQREKSGNQVSLRWILLHMVEEYARHNGHADLLRERIDGTCGV